MSVLDLNEWAAVVRQIRVPADDHDDVRNAGDVNEDMRRRRVANIAAIQAGDWPCDTEGE